MEISSIQGKVWGTTQLLFSKNNVEFRRITAAKGGYSSKHLHAHKFNAFYVESGKLMITTWKNDYDLVDKTVVTSAQTTVVSPGEYHMFEALEDTVAYEIYWVDLPEKDILRDNCGGVKDG